MLHASPSSKASLPHPRPTALGHHRKLSRAPAVMQQHDTGCLFHTCSCVYVSASLPVRPALSFPLSVHEPILHVCIYFCLQKGSSAPSFQTPYMCVAVVAVVELLNCVPLFCDPTDCRPLGSKPPERPHVCVNV